MFASESSDEADSFLSVASYAAFLRGINVSGRRATKAQLTPAFEACGFESVSTFRASGNVLFEQPGRTKPKASDIEAALEREIGFSSQVFLRSAGRLAEVSELDPFTSKQVKASKGKLQVIFLEKKPSKSATDRALKFELDSDPIAIDGSELLWLPAEGTQTTELDLKGLWSVLGPWTMRTMGTVEQIAAKLC